MIAARRVGAGRWLCGAAAMFAPQSCGAIAAAYRTAGRFISAWSSGALLRNTFARHGKGSKFPLLI